MFSIVNRLVAIAVLIVGSSAAHAQCDPGDILVGMDETHYYCMRRARYEGSPAQRASVRYCNASRILAADQNTLHELGFAADSQRFEMFESVAREQKQEFEFRVYDALLDTALEATGVIVNSTRSLNPWNVNHAIRMLDERGFGFPVIKGALRRVAATKGKPAMAKAFRDFADLVKAAKEGWNTGRGIAGDPGNAGLRLLVGGLKIMQGNPELGLAVTTVELGEGVAYLAYVGANVDDLAQATDDKLSRVAALAGRLNDHAKDLRSFRVEWRRAMGISTGSPVCS